MLNNRIELLLKLKDFLQTPSEELDFVKEKAERQNGWFTQEFINLAIDTICNFYLTEDALRKLTSNLICAEESKKSYCIGITMAGNIPLVGFHDFLCVFLSGYKQLIKFSSKDDTLLPHFISKLYAWDDSIRNLVSGSEMLKECDVYVATGSNQSAKYFEQYFAKYPHIIRRNRTSVAVLNGHESTEELTALADDVYQYFGLGCRNVTKIYVPLNYNFEALLHAFKKYDELKHHNKFRNNIDYNLALYILNNQFYMSNESILLIENKSIFSSIGVLHYEYYSDMITLKNGINELPDVQAIVGHGFIPFGKAQTPSITDFADGVNTIEFLNGLAN